MSLTTRSAKTWHFQASSVERETNMENRLEELVAQLTSLARRIDAWKVEIAHKRTRGDAEALAAVEQTLIAVAAESEAFSSLVMAHSDIAGVQQGQINGFAFALMNLMADCNAVIADLAIPSATITMLRKR
jgi:hypothetical protein